MKTVISILVIICIASCASNHNKKLETDKYLGFWECKKWEHNNAGEPFKSTIEILSSNEHFYLRGNGFNIEIYYNSNDRTFKNETRTVNYILSSQDSLLRIVENSIVNGIYKKIN